MKLSHAMAAGLGLAAAIATAGPAPDLDKLIARHAEARGGTTAIEAVRTFESDIRIGKILATVTVREVRINPTLDPTRFDPP